MAPGHRIVHAQEAAQQAGSVHSGDVDGEVLFARERLDALDDALNSRLIQGKRHSRTPSNCKEPPMIPARWPKEGRTAYSALKFEHAEHIAHECRGELAQNGFSQAPRGAGNA